MDSLMIMTLAWTWIWGCSRF